MEDGMQTFEIRKEEMKQSDVRNKMLRGQLNAAFKMRK
jgi:MerR family transcriptional regulator, global nitrogen regulator